MSFDRLAPHYRWMEAVLAGSKLQRCRTAFLERVRSAENALILGEGNGRFLQEFLKANAHARVTCLDASRRMLEMARQRVETNTDDLSRVEFVQANALRWNGAERKYDLVVTHFFLDCFPPEPLELLIRNVAANATPQATWLLADFQKPATGMRRWRAALILKMMYAFFGVMTALPAKRLTAPDPFLRELGFQLSERRESEWGLLHSDLWLRG